MTSALGPSLARAGLWAVYASHMLRLYDRPTLRLWSAAHGFADLTGEPAVDSNVCSLYGEASIEDARALVAHIDAAGTPAIIAMSSEVDDDAIAAYLRAAGFTLLDPEVAMWRPPMPIPPRDHPFDVRVATVADMRVVGEVIASAHGTPPDIAERVFNLDALVDGDVRCYVAYDGDEAASTGWLVARDGFLSLHEMMTSPRHRRRGAGRAILQEALTDMAPLGPGGTLLWASPMGRPMYESIGFAPFDTVHPWERGATEEELALIGAAKPASTSS